MTTALLKVTPQAARHTTVARIGRVGLGLLQVAAAALFAMSGAAKLSGTAQMVALFDAIGIGQWFRLVTGGLEVIGALLLLAPPVTGFGALLLAVVMVGAVFTHVVVLHSSPALPASLLAAMLVVAWAQRERIERAAQLLLSPSHEPLHVVPRQDANDPTA